MGTGGWSQLVDWENLDDHFLVLNADNLFWIDVARFLERHRSAGATASIAAIEIPTNEHAAYEVLLPSEARDRLMGYVDREASKPYIEANHHVFVSSGWYIMTPGLRSLIPEKNPISNETDVWPMLAASGHPLGFYHATEPWFDSGTSERIARIEAFLGEHPDV
jgi:NDP-sugar pyrophosphorylase family protein